MEVEIEQRRREDAKGGIAKPGNPDESNLIQPRFEFGGEFFGEALGFFVATGADVEGFGFEDEFAVLVEDAMAEVEADALDEDGPDFDGEEVVVARHKTITQMSLDDGEDMIALLPFEDGGARGAHEFAAGGLEEVEVAGVVNVIADGAFGVGDAVLIAEGFGHGRSVKRRVKSSTSKMEFTT
jgi:hypothetical protein